MISKNTNKNEVKLLATIMVFVMAFAGVVLISSDTSYADDTEVSPSTNEASVGDKEYETLAAAIDAVEKGSANGTITLLKDVEIKQISGDVSINGDHKMITFTGEVYCDDIYGKVTMRNVTIDSKAGLVGIHDGPVTFEGVTVESEFIAYTSFNILNGCSFHKLLQFQISDDYAYDVKNSTINELCIYPCNTEGHEVTVSNEKSSIVIDQKTIIDIMSLVANNVKLENCKLDVGEIKQFEWTEKDNKTGEMKDYTGEGKLEIGKGVEFTPTSGTTVVDVGVEVCISESGVLSIAKMVLEGKLVMQEGSIFEGIIQNVTGGVTNSITSQAGIKAGKDGIEFSKGSIVMNGSILSADDNGIIKITGRATLDANTSVKNLLIEPGAELFIPVGMTLDAEAITNKGAAIVEGTISANTIDNCGRIAKTSSANVDAEITGNQPVIESTGSDDSLGLKNVLENDYTISKKAFLAGDLTVKEGVILTIASTGSLDLNGHKLILIGNLVVVNGGSISALDNGTKTMDAIQIMESGSISNNGIIGKGDKAVMVTSDIGSVLMDDVTGVEFGLTKTIVSVENRNEVKYVLTVSGTVSKKNSDCSLVMDGVYISDLKIRDLENTMIKDSQVVKNGTLDIGSKASVRIDKLTLRTGASLNVDGELTGTSATVSMENGAVAVINGDACGIKFSAKTGDYLTYSESGSKNVAEEQDDLVDSEIIMTGLNGLTIEVTSKTYTKTDGASRTEQMLNVYGAASYTKDATTTEDNTTSTSGTISIDGSVYVPAGKELALLKDGMTFGEDGTFITEGTIKAVDEVDNYKGTSYSMKDSEGDITNYYTTFDNAYAAIADADGKTLTIKGGFTFKSEYTIGAEQIIELADTGTYTISKNGKITVSDEGTLDINVTIDVKGVLVVMDGGSCDPTKVTYQVMSENDDGDVTYSGAEWAIENATAGSTINIVGGVNFEKKVTVPEGVTVRIGTGVTITAKEGMVVNGTVENEGAITISEGKDLIISGTVENEGTVAFESSNGPKSNLTVTGTLVNATGSALTISEGGSPAFVSVNAAKYVDGADVIYTSVSKAVAAVSEMDIPAEIDVTGKFTEASDITLGEGMKLKINGEVVLNSIRLTVASTLTVNGKLTADVIGAVGKADTTGAVSDAVVGLDKVSKVSFGLSYNESNATSTLTLTINDGYHGAVKVEKGAVSVETPEDGITFTTENSTTAPAKTFAIGSDAVVNLGASTITNKDKAFVNEGTLNINGAVKYSGLLEGDVVVKEDVELKLVSVAASGEIDGEDYVPALTTVVAGTITLSEKDEKVASVEITGEARIGTAPKTLGASGAVSGKVTFADDAYAIVFEGSTFASTVDGIQSTSYSVNGIALGTIYTTQTDILISAMDEVVYKLGDLVIPTTTTGEGDEAVTEFDSIGWVDGTGMAVGSNSCVGSVESVDVALGYKSVPVKVSAGPGIQIYIDDLRVTVTDNSYVIGTHTISVYLEPNYEGTPVIKLNGVAITDGTFEVTADMIGEDNMIVVTGATYVEPSTPSIVIPSQPAESDDDMGLTEYLLIVLVILAAILVIVVAVRMMRS